MTDLPRRNHWRLIPGGRLTLWRGFKNGRERVPASIVWLGRRAWWGINLGHRAWTPLGREVFRWGPFEIERWPRS